MGAEHMAESSVEFTALSTKGIGNVGPNIFFADAISSIGMAYSNQGCRTVIGGSTHAIRQQQPKPYNLKVSK